MQLLLALHPVHKAAPEQLAHLQVLSSGKRRGVWGARDASKQGVSPTSWYFSWSCLLVAFLLFLIALLQHTVSLVPHSPTPTSLQTKSLEPRPPKLGPELVVDGVGWLVAAG